MTLTNAPLNKKFYILACISFLLTATGVILVNYFAVIFYDLRAMIVQLSAVITMFGTLVHVFLIDPVLSRAADENKETLLHYSVTYLHSRLMVSAMLSVTFYILYMFS
jgi:hypothetical protein